MSNQWRTGLCQCTLDVPQCLDTICCQCCAGSRQWNAIEGRSDTCDLMHCVLHACCALCSNICIRIKVVEKYNIDESSVVSCLLATCCGSCSLCQTHRELTVQNQWPGGTLCHKQPGQYEALN